MSINFHKCTYMSEAFTRRGRHPRGVGLTAWSPERSGLAHYNSMYYSIVHTRLIHASDMYVHVYARWVGFQMADPTSTSPLLITVTAR